MSPILHPEMDLEAEDMATHLTPISSQSFPRNFWLGLALAAGLWTLVGLATILG